MPRASRRQDAGDRNRGSRCVSTLLIVSAIAALLTPSAFVSPPSSTARELEDQRKCGRRQVGALLASVAAASVGSEAAHAQAQFPQAGSRGMHGLSYIAEWAPTEPPKPSADPVLRVIQERAWVLEPIHQIRMYLKSIMLKVKVDTGVFSKHYFVHWGLASNNYDILTEKEFKEANKMDRVRIDTNINDPDNNVFVYVYKSPEDQQYVAENQPVYDFFSLPQGLLDNIEKTKLRRVGDGGPTKYR